MKRRDMLIGAAMTSAAGVAALAAAGSNSALAQTPAAAPPAPTPGGVGTLDRIIKEKKIIYMAPGPSGDFDNDGRLDLFLPNWWPEIFPPAIASGSTPKR